MRVYLADHVGDGSARNEFRPSIAEIVKGPLDLRPDPRRQEGRVLIATPEPVTSLPRGVIDLGDDLDGKSTAVKDALGRALSVSFDQDTLRGIIAELLIMHGDSKSRETRTRWPRLKATRRGRHVIRLGGEVVYDAPAPRLATVSDDFNRTDDPTGLGANWTLPAIHDWRVENNQAVQYDNVSAFAEYASDQDTDDQYAEADIIDAGGTPGVIVRKDPSEPTYYRAADVNNSARLHKVIDDQISLVDNSGAGTIAPYHLRLEFDGSDWAILVDGSPYTSGTDSDITGNLRAGIYGLSTSNNAADAIVDNFEAGDLGAGGTTFQESMAGAATPAGALARTPGKALAGTATPAGAAARTAQQTRGGTVTPIGAARRQTAKTAGGAATPAGAVLKAAAKAAAGTITPAGAHEWAKKLLLAVAGTVTPAGLLAKATSAARAGTATPAGTATHKTAKTAAGDVTPAGTVSRETQATHTGATTPAGALARTLARTLEGTASAAATLVRKTAKALTGAATPAGSLANATAGFFQRLFSGTVTPTGARTQQAAKTTTGTTTPAGTVRRKTATSQAGSIEAAGAVTKAAGLRLAGTLTAAGAVASAIVDLTVTAIGRTIRHQDTPAATIPGPATTRTIPGHAPGEDT